MREGIILAGGLGTRLSAVIKELPKSMAPINNRPFLEILLTSLAQKGFTRIVLSLGYMAEKIIAYFGKEFQGIELIYSIEEKPLGTGGGVRLAIDKCIEDHIFVFNGDTYLNLEVEEVNRQWQRNRSTIIIGLEINNTLRYGRLLIKDGKVRGFTEKGMKGVGIINAGCYVLRRNELDDFPLYYAFSLETDYFAKEVKDSPFDLFLTSGKFIDIGIPEDYLRAQLELTQDLE